MKTQRAFWFCLLLGIACYTLCPTPTVLATDSETAPPSCVLLTEPLSIPEDGSWVEICFEDDSAPAEGLVSAVNARMLVDHPDPAQLEMELTRADTDVVLRLPVAEHSQMILGEATAAHVFDGLPAQAEWVFRVRDAISGGKGSVTNVSLSARYAPDGATPLLQEALHGGKPTTSRIPEGALIDLRSRGYGASGAMRTVPETRSGTDWQTIMVQDFESAFPTAGWEVFDARPSDLLEYYWDDDDYRPYNGYRAAWPANGGADAIDPAVANYPPDMDAWMIYGPVDLSQATAAQVSFRLWRDTEMNWDWIDFGLSTNGIVFDWERWDGYADWEHEVIDVGSFAYGGFLGASQVWLAWRFASDNINDLDQYEGAWIDDIVLSIYEPGDVTVYGWLNYADRFDASQYAEAVKVQLWDSDADGNDLLGEDIADEHGSYDFASIWNWDEDDPDPDPANRRLDLYLVYCLENDRYVVTDTDRIVHCWGSPSIAENVESTAINLSAQIGVGTTNRRAMWIFQDMRRTMDFFLTNMNPLLDPGFLTAHWKEGQTVELPCFGSCFIAVTPAWAHIFIADEPRLSTDTVVHELGHHIMWNLTGQWLSDAECLKHGIFSHESAECAWLEGWADFFALAVNDDPCYDFYSGSCGGASDQDHFNLEAHSRNDDPGEFAWGDGVEGRVAGALWDLGDSENEPPYDNTAWGIAPIADLALCPEGQTDLYSFWDDYADDAQNPHWAVRSLYLNTIDYNHPPDTEAIPDQSTYESIYSTHLINLWDYVEDAESPDAYLSFQISFSDPECGITLDSHWVNVAPWPCWTGSCYTEIEVSDSLTTSEQPLSFDLYVLPFTSRNALPVMLRD